jgi:phosphate acyltransferase
MALNMGREKIKGPPELHRAYDALEKCREAGLLNFVGNAEGNDIGGLLDDADEADAFNPDVLIFNGLGGNVLLKYTSKLVNIFKEKLREVFHGSMRGKFAGLLVRAKLEEAFRQFSSEHQGTDAVGFTKRVIIVQGSSKSGAYEQALYRATTTSTDVTRASLKIIAADELLGLSEKRSGSQA